MLTALAKFKNMHALFWLLLAVAAWVRYQGLLDFCLDWDEANALAQARLPFSKVIPMVLNWDMHPPGLHLLLHGWIKLWGESDLSVRLFAWFFGMLGIIGTYCLALRLTASKPIAWITMLLSIASPMLWRYSQLSTTYVVEYAAVMFSFLFLFNLIQNQQFSIRHHTFWLYVTATLVLLWAHSLGPVILVLQGSYLWLVRKKLPPLFLKQWLVLAGIILLPNLYHIWLNLQPWSLANTLEQQEIHQSAPFWMFLLAPVNLMLLGYDIRDAGNVPAPPVLLAYSIAGYGLLVWAWNIFKKSFSVEIQQLVLCLGVLPIIVLYLGSLAFSLPVFHFRTLLYCLAAFHLLLATLVINYWQIPAKKPVALAVVALVVFLQIFPVFKRPLQEDPWRYLAQQIQKDIQPEDGVVIYPGWNHIALMRYLDPKHFGLTPWELSHNPENENYHHMFHGESDKYFLVSGDDVLQRPDIAIRFDAFQQKHKRIWLVGHSLTLVQMLRCDTRFMTLGPNGKLYPATCYGPS